MLHTRGGLASRLASVLLASLILIPLPRIAVPRATAAPQPTHQPPLLAITDATLWIRPGDRYYLRARLAWPGPSTSPELVVASYLAPPVETRSEFDLMVEGRVQPSLGLRLAAETVPPLRPGEEREIYLQADPNRAPLPPDPAVFPLQVRVESRGRALISALTWVIWLPSEPSPPLNMTLILPLDWNTTNGTSGPQEAGDVPKTLEAIATATVPLALAVNGRFLDFPNAPPRPAADSSPETRPQLRKTLDALKNAASRPGVELLASTYAPVDLPALAGGLPLQHARQQISRTAALLSALGFRALPLFAPYAGRLDPASATLLLQEHFTAALISGDSLSPPADPRFAPAAPAPVSWQGETLMALLPDETLSSRFSQLGTSLSALDFLAEAAVTWLQAPSVRRVATIYPTSVPDPGALTSLFSLLPRVPFLRFLTPSQALSLPRGPARKLLPRPNLPTPPPELTQALTLYSRLASMVEGEPQPLHIAIALLLSAEGGDWSKSGPGSAEHQMLTAGLSVLRGELNKLRVDVTPVTLTSRTGWVPVTLVNGTAYPLRARVSVSSSRIAFPSPELNVLLNPGQQVLLFAARAEVTGTELVEVSLAPPSGGPPLLTAELPVRSTAYNRIGLAITALAALALIVRGARRPRRGKGAPPAPPSPPKDASTPRDEGLTPPGGGQPCDQDTAGAFPRGRPSAATDGGASAHFRSPEDRKDPDPASDPEGPDGADLENLEEPEGYLVAEIDRGKLFRSGAAMAIGTAVSRLTGFLRTAALVASIGVAEDRLADAYNLANTTPNIVFELVAGGILSGAAVPLFVHALHESREAFSKAVRRIATAVALVLTLLTLLGVLLSPLVAQLYSRGVSPSHTQLLFRRAATVFLAFFLPQIVLYGLAAVATAAVNATGRFALPSLAPAVNNLLVVATALLLLVLPGGHPPTLSTISPAQTLALALGTTAGVAGMALLPWIQLRSLLRLPRGASLRKQARRHRNMVPPATHEAPTEQDQRKHPLVRPEATGEPSGRGPRLPAFLRTLANSLLDPTVQRLARLSRHILLYVATNQLALLVVMALASHVQGGFTAYQAAFTIFIIPHGLLGVSLHTVLLTPLSRFAVLGDRDRFNRAVSLGLRASALLITPATLGYLILGRPIVQTALEHGAVTTASVDLVASALLAFTVGLPGFTLFQLLVRAFYALHDSRTPARINFISTLAGTLLQIALFASLRTSSGRVAALALGYSLSYCLGAVLALWSLHQTTGFRAHRELVRTLARSAAASLFMAAPLAWAVAELWTPITSRGTGLARTSSEFLLLAALALAGALIYLFSLRAVSRRDWDLLTRSLRASLSRVPPSR